MLNSEPMSIQSFDVLDSLNANQWFGFSGSVVVLNEPLYDVMLAQPLS